MQVHFVVNAGESNLENSQFVRTPGDKIGE
jgi:hypothetical protein